MPSSAKPVHNGKIKEDDLAGLIAELNFIPDKGKVNALSYELGMNGGSLKHYFRLLTKIRDTEVVQYETQHKKQIHPTPGLTPAYRVMGVLWFGKYYHSGLVIEIFGQGIQDHMTEKAHELGKLFDNEVLVVTRTLTERVLEWDEPK